MCGPLSPETVGMIMGRGGLSSQGFIVYLGIIDGGCKEGSEIMLHVKKKHRCNLIQGIEMLSWGKGSLLKYQQPYSYND